MPLLKYDDVSIHYEDIGSGFPVLLFAPGGMRSAASFWDRAPWNPVEQLAPNFRVIAMDQRNAGGSSAPIRGSDGWASYTSDHLALLDHLGIRQCHVLGMCIGGAFLSRLALTSPERVAAGVALQPIGLDGNLETFRKLFDGWAEEQRPAHPEATDEDWAGYRAGMYETGQTLFSVPDEAIPKITTPLLVLMGDDEHHPSSASRMLAERAPNARLIERWKDPEHIPAAQAAVADFLAEHTPS